MEFLKLDKERENQPEELQSMHLSVCLSLFACLCLSVCLSVFTLRKRKCPCTHLSLLPSPSLLLLPLLPSSSLSLSPFS